MIISKVLQKELKRERIDISRKNQVNERKIGVIQEMAFFQKISQKKICITIFNYICNPIWHLLNHIILWHN